MYWVHLGIFHGATSRLNWYKIVCVFDIACTLSRMKSMNTFCMCFQSEIPRHFLWRCIAVLIKNLTVFMLVYIPTQHSRAICRNMGIYDVFTLCPPGKKYLRFILFASPIVRAWQLPSTFPPSHCQCLGIHLTFKTRVIHHSDVLLFSYLTITMALILFCDRLIL